MLPYFKVPGFALLAIVSILALGGCGGSQDSASPDTPKKYIVASEASFPPMEFIDDYGQMVGFDIDIISAIAREENLHIELQNIAWDGIFGALKSGSADLIISSVTITDERKAQFDFTEPYYQAGQSLLVRTGDESKYPDLETLKSKPIGVQLGTTGAEHLTKLGGYEMKQYNTAGLAIIDLANEQVEGVLIDRPVADYHASQKPEFKEKVVVVGQPHTTENFGIVVRKGETELLGKLNSGLEKIKANGTLQKLETKWFR